MVAARLHAISVVVLLLALIGALPGLVPRATAEDRVVTVAIQDLEPFVMTTDNIETGFTIDILNEIAKHTGWTYTYVNPGGVQGLLKAVTDRRVDFGASAVSITAERAKILDFSQPILNAGLQIMVPAGTTEHTAPGLFDFLKLLFSKAVLIWLAAAILLAVIPAHIVWWNERHHGDSPMSKKYFPGIFQAFAYGLGMLAAQPDEMPKHWLNRVLGILLAFVSIVFVAYYTATLTANLTVDKFNSQISSPSDLVGKRVCTVDRTTSANYLSDQNIGFTPVPAIKDCYTQLKAGQFDAVVFDAPVLAFYVAHNGAGVAALVGTVFHDEDYGIAFPNGSELRKEADEALLKMREDGDFDMIKQKWFGAES
ncbi:MAG: transporter substrate-binding domain-containing protein [Mycobacterium sp.]